MMDRADRLALASALLRGGLTELRRLRVVRGRHTRTRRRIAAARGLVAAAAVVLCAPFLADEARAFGDPRFAPALLVPNPGGGSVYPTFADIDDDGDLDAFVGANDGLVYFFRNTGNAAVPAFAPGSTGAFGLSDVGGGSYPDFVDIDDDGDLDAFVGAGDGAIAFFENTGSAGAPAFSTPSTNPFGLSSVIASAAPNLADIDGDGDLDAFVGTNDGNIVFFENTGSAAMPAFAAPATNPYGLVDVGFLAKPTFGDIDGDGDLDVLVGNNFGDTQSFRNQGDPSTPVFETGTFVAFAKNVEAPTEASPELVDIDGDGDLDIFVGDGDGNTVLWENTGTPTSSAFSPQRPEPFGLVRMGNGGHATPDLVDIDGDGDLDAFIGSGDGDTFYFENTGSAAAAAFAPSQTTNLTFPQQLGGMSRPELADIDADGDLDAFLGGESSGKFYRNTGSATSPAFVFEGDNQFGLPFVDLALGDVDGDGDLDAVRGGSGGGTSLVRNTGSATMPAFASSQSETLNDVGSYSSPKLADVDGDGDLDLLIGNGDGDIVFVRNVGSASTPFFGPVSTNPFGLSDVGSRAAPELVDIDGDGDLDAFVGNGFGSTLFFENTRPARQNQFAAGVTNPFGLTAVPGGYSSDPFASPAFVDIDGDGDFDLVSGNAYGHFFFFRNTGTVTAPAFESSSSNPFGLSSAGGRSTPTFADTDGDGDQDLLSGKQLNGDLVFFANTGSAMSPAFAGPATNPAGLQGVDSQSAPELADIDGDGDLDALVGIYDGSTVHFENTGDAMAPSFAAPETNAFGTGDVGSSAKPALVDIDGDGDLDLFVGDSGGRVVAFPNGGTVSDPAFGGLVEALQGADVGTYADPTFVDIDGDGDRDAFVGNRNGDFVFFENQRVSRFVVTSTLEAGDCSVAFDGPDGVCAALSPSLACDGTGPCTLRAAFDEIHEDPGVDAGRIEFDIPGTPPHVIGIGSWPLVIDVPMTLDGTANPPCEGPGVIEIEGDTLDLLIREDARICGITLK